MVADFNTEISYFLQYRVKNPDQQSLFYLSFKSTFFKTRK